MNKRIQSFILAFLTVFTGQMAAFDLLAPFAKLYWHNQVGHRLSKAEQKNGYLLATLADDARIIHDKLITKDFTGKTNLADYADKTCWDLNLLYDEFAIHPDFERAILVPKLNELITAFNTASVNIQKSYTDATKQELSNALNAINEFNTHKGVSQQNAAYLNEFLHQAQQSDAKIKKIITKERVITSLAIAAAIAGGYALWKYGFSRWFKNQLFSSPAKLPENVHHLPAVAQKGTTCGIHAATNALAIDEKFKENMSIDRTSLQNTLNNTETKNKKLTEWNLIREAYNSKTTNNHKIPSSNLDQEDIADVLQEYDINNVHCIRYLEGKAATVHTGTSFGELHGTPLKASNFYQNAFPLNCPGSINNLDEHLAQLKKDAKPDIIHILLHTPLGSLYGHWVQASVVKDAQGKIEIYYTDSMNGTVYAGSCVEKFLNYLHNAVKA